MFPSKFIYQLKSQLLPIALIKMRFWIILLLGISIYVSVASTASCDSDPFVGDCKAAIPMYFYNSTSKECEQVIYGGCGATEENENFDSEATCIDQCLLQEE